MNSRCLIILSYYENRDRAQLLDAAENTDYLICADGGADIAAEFGLFPDCVIGDFDSTSMSDRFDCLYITYPAEKDLTDAEACVAHAVEMGYSEITIFGGMGGRLDHTLGNIALLSEYYSTGREIRFMDSRNMIFLLENGTAELLPSPFYKYFSIISLNSTAEGVSISGARYPLNNIVLQRASTLGISNEITDENAVISVRSGQLLIVRSADGKDQN